MKKSVLLAACVLAATIGFSGAATMLTKLTVEEDLYSIVRGGRLYDNWFREIGETAPTKSHPAYPPDKTFADDPGTNWRCQECHGWDYRGRNGVNSTGRHATGIKGIDEMAGADPETIIARLKDETHAYRKQIFPGLIDSQAPVKRLIAILREKTYKDRGWMSKRDFRDLAMFVSKGQVDMARLIDREGRKARGDKTNGETYFATICAICHGRDGLKIKSMQPLAKFAADDPWETLHKILNGHPGVMMPPFRVLGVEIAGDILAYVQTLPKKQALASVVHGGRLYDNWPKEANKPVPSMPHHAYPRDKAYADDPATNWRCKECHGWDYRGRTGAYSKGRHATGIKGIHGMAGATPESIIAILVDDTHEFERVLELRDLEDLAAFVSRGQIDMDAYIERETKSVKGDKTKSLTYFSTLCATCHGMDGRKIITMRPLGHIARNQPWEALHKMLNGHPGRIMPPLRVLETQVLVNILAYVQTLPAER